MKVFTLDEIISMIKPLDESAINLAQARWDSIAKPLHSLGLLEESIIRIAGVTGNAEVSLDKRCAVVMCADNGVIAEGVTQTGSDITALVTENLTKGQTSVCVMGRSARCDVIPVDIGVAKKLECDGLLVHKIAYGTENIARGAAMTREQAVDALTFGASLVAELKSQGYKIIATGEMGIGNTTTSSAVTAALLGVMPETVTGRGAGLTSDGLKRKILAVERALMVNKINHDTAAIDVLARVGGFDIAGLAGVFLGGAAFGVPIIIDGFISAVSALVADRICSMSREYWIAAHLSKEPAGRMLLNALSMRPLITAEMCLGEGTGAVSVLPLLDMGLAVYGEMSTFGDINMDSYKPLK